MRKMRDYTEFLRCNQEKMNFTMISDGGVTVLRKISLFLALIYILFNFVVSYVNIGIFVTLSFIATVFILTSFLNDITINNTKQKILIFIFSILIEGLILLISAFIFESGYVLTPRQSLFETNGLIRLYSIFGILVIQELIKFIINKTRIAKEKI